MSAEPKPLPIAVPGPEEAPIGDLLAHAGRELRDLCSAAYDLEAAVGALISSPDNRGEGMRGLQELDRLIQHIDGLADYLTALSEAARDLGPVHVAAARKLIKVARLADGLAGRAAELREGGDVDFF
jgi:hypothetical protein